MSAPASCRCGATWTGSRIEHCPSCHHTFTGTTAGDKHRTGDHAVFTGPNRRRCLTPDEMLVKGMSQNERGYWTTGRQKASFWLSGTGQASHWTCPAGDLGAKSPSQHSSDGLEDFDWGVTPERISQALLETPQQEESA